jgi:hypothetical protein
MNNLNKSLTLGLVFGLLTACGGGTADTGTMSLHLTDAPVDSASKVVVEFTGVELHPDGASTQRFDFDEPRQIDLLALTGGESTLLLDEVTLPAGRYGQLRLIVNADKEASDSYIELTDGSVHPLFIPSGNQSGLKLNKGFVVPADGHASFTIDFDLRKSVTKPNGLDGAYILRPTLRLVDDAHIGAIAGSVAAEIVTTDGCSPAVYIYAGADVEPGDVGSSTEPLSSAAVMLDEATGSFDFRAAFLLPGEYTVAFTCMAAADDPETVDEIEFSAPVTVTVAAGTTAKVDFDSLVHQ